MSKKKPTLIVMMGNCGSGKSTYARKVAQKGYLYVSRDDIRTMIGGGTYIFNKNLEPAVFDIEHYAIAMLMDTEKNIIIDEVGLSKNLRAPYVELAGEYGYSPVLYIMPRLKKTESINRRMTNPRGDISREEWAKVWDKFDRIWEDPDKSEGWDQIVKLTQEEIDNGKIRNMR